MKRPPMSMVSGTAERAARPPTNNALPFHQREPSHDFGNPLDLSCHPVLGVPHKAQRIAPLPLKSYPTPL